MTMPVLVSTCKRNISNVKQATVENVLRVNAPISSSQWGFTSNRFTVSALIRVLDDWQCALDQGSEVQAYDVSKGLFTFCANAHSMRIGRFQT